MSKGNRAEIEAGGPTRVHRPPRRPEDDKGVVILEAVSSPSDDQGVTHREVVQQGTKKGKGERVPRQAPEGVPLPRKGIPGGLYWASDKVGFPNKNYRRLTAADRLEQEISLSEEWLLALSNVRGMSFSITYANNQGGSSKTNNAIYVGSLIARLTHVVAYVAPATANTKTARAALVAGIDPNKTLRISEFAKRADQLTEFVELDQLVQRNKYGLRVLGNDSSEEVDIKRKFGLAYFLRVAKVLEGKATLRIWDQGNDNVGRDELGLEATRRSDVMVFPATAKHLTSLYALSETLTSYIGDDTAPDEFEESVPPQARFSTRYKAQNGLVVINRVDKKDDPNEFWRYTQSIDGVGNPTGDLGYRGDRLVIPEDPYIADPSPETIVCDLDAILRNTYLAYAIEAYMILVKVGRQRSLKLPEPSPTLVNLWERRGVKAPNLRPAPAPLLHL